MTRILLTLCAAHALSACTPKPLVVATPPEPFPVAIAPACFEPCATLPLWRADADGTAPWDTLGALAITDSEIRNDCEARRAHCAAPLRRLLQVGLIRNSVEER